jgi:hypothetical protein
LWNVTVQITITWNQYSFSRFCNYRVSKTHEEVGYTVFVVPIFAIDKGNLKEIPQKPIELERHPEFGGKELAECLWV